MSRSIDLYDEPDRRDYIGMLFRSLDYDDISIDLLRQTLESIVRNDAHIAPDSREHKGLTEFLTRVIDKYRFGEIDLASATQDIDRLVTAAERNRQDLMHVIYVGREALDRIAA